MEICIALCHFCEKHGPRVVFVAQPQHGCPHGEGPSGSTESTSSSSPVPIRSESPLLSRFNTIPVFESRDEKLLYGTPRDVDERCAACTSTGGQFGYVSVDKEKQITFTSTQIPADAWMHKRVRQAAIRSLSIEIGTPSDNQNEKKREFRPPPRPGDLLPPPPGELFRAPNPPPMYPSGSGGAGRSYGGGRSYDGGGAGGGGGWDARGGGPVEREGYVFYGDQEWGYTLSLAFKVKDAKARGFNRTYSLIFFSPHMLFILANFDTILANLTAMAARIQDLSKIVCANEMQPASNASVRSANQVNQAYFRRIPTTYRPQIDPSRSLVTITGEDNIWISLHKQMLLAMRSEILRFTNTQMEGKPTQDAQVINELTQDQVDELALGNDNQHEVTLNQLLNLRAITVLLMDTGGDAAVNRFLFQLCSGGQIVIVGDVPWAVRAALHAMTNVLPIGCIKIRTNADEYYHPYRYNLLGLGSSDDLRHWHADALVYKISHIPQRDDRDTLEGCRLHLVHEPLKKLPATLPQVVERFKMLLLDLEVPENVLDCAVRAARDQWVNKCKILYVMQRQPRQFTYASFASISRTRLHDKPVMGFWQNGLSKAWRDLCLTSGGGNSRSSPSASSSGRGTPMQY